MRVIELLTPAVLAQIIGCSPAVSRRIKDDPSSMRMGDLARLAAAFKVTPSQLLSATE